MRIKPFGPNRPLLRSFRSGIGKSAIIYPVTLLHSIALGAVNLGIVFFLRDRFGATPTVVGTVAALYSVAYFIGCFVFRPFTYVLLPRFSLLISTTINIVFIGGMLLFDNIVAVAVCNVFFGFGVSLFWPPIMGWLSTGLEGSDLGKTLGRFNLSWSLGMIVSPYVAGLLSEIDVGLPLVVCMILLLASSVTVLIGSITIRGIREDRHREPKPAKQSETVDRSTPLRYPAWIGLACAYLLMGIFGVVFPMHARTNLGMNESAIGGALLLRAVTNTVMFVVLGKLTVWHHKPIPIILPQVILAGCCAVLAVNGHTGAYLAVLPIIGVCTATAYSESIFHGVAGAAVRARRMAIHEALLVMGSVVGSFGGSFVFQVTSVRQVFGVTAVLCILGALAQSVFLLVRRKGSASGETASPRT